LLPALICADISANVSDTLEYDHISKDSVKVQCVQLKSKYNTYASFSVTVMVEELVKDRVINLLMSSDGWPEGVLVRKYYTNKPSCLIDYGLLHLTVVL